MADSDPQHAGLTAFGKLMAVLLPLVGAALVTSGGGMWTWMLTPAQDHQDIAASVARIVAYGGAVAAIAAFVGVCAYGAGSGKMADALQGVAASLALWSAVIIGIFSFMSLK